MSVDRAGDLPLQSSHTEHLLKPENLKLNRTALSMVRDAGNHAAFHPPVTVLLCDLLHASQLADIDSAQICSGINLCLPLCFSWLLFLLLRLPLCLLLCTLLPVFPFFVPVLLNHVYCDFSGSHPLLSPSLCLPRGFSCCCAACSSAVIVLRALQLLLCCLLFCQGDDWPVTHYWLDVQCSYRPC